MRLHFKAPAEWERILNSNSEGANAKPALMSDMLYSMRAQTGQCDMRCIVYVGASSMMTFSFHLNVRIGCERDHFQDLTYFFITVRF